MQVKQKNEARIVSFLQMLEKEKQLNFQQIFQRRLISSNRTVTSQTLKTLVKEGNLEARSKSLAYYNAEGTPMANSQEV